MLSLDDAPENTGLSRFEQLYNKYKKVVYYIAVEYMVDTVLAEDAMQETFFKLSNYVEKIEDIDSSKTLSFVGVVTRSVCIDMLRTEKAYRKNTENFHRERESAAQTANELLGRIRELPEIYRDVLILKYYFALPNKKIGEICNVSEGTVRKRLERARKLLVEVDV